jgi:very-short-patch-repair endonuclease
MSLPKMFFGAVASVFENAKDMRQNMTEAERKLWSRINNKQLGFRFKPQHPISRFVADFYCHKAKLIIEVDGEIHLGRKEKEYDENREAVLKRLGIKVLRFTNEEVINDMEKVVEEIRKHLPSPTF